MQWNKYFYRYGAVSLGVSKQMGAILKLLNDPTPNVRDTAFNTILEIYRHVGEKLRINLQKKSIINPHKYVKFNI